MLTNRAAQGVPASGSFVPREAVPPLPNALQEGEPSISVGPRASSDHTVSSGPLPSFSAGALSMPGSILAAAWTSRTSDFEFCFWYNLVITSLSHFACQWFWRSAFLLTLFSLSLSLPGQGSLTFPPLMVLFSPKSCLHMPYLPQCGFLSPSSCSVSSLSPQIK